MTIDRLDSVTFRPATVNHGPSAVLTGLFHLGDAVMDSWTINDSPYLDEAQWAIANLFAAATKRAPVK